MFISPSEYAKVYEEIKRTSLSHSTCKLIIFVSCLNIDALCAGKILSIVLRKELIQYQLIPVVGYSDLKMHFDKLDFDVTNVILIGCGAMLDIESFFDIDVQQYRLETSNSHESKLESSPFDTSAFRRRIFVIDGHRPWNLDNIFGSSMVVCFDDGYIDATLKEEEEAYKVLANVEDDENEESEDSGDSESESAENDDAYQQVEDFIGTDDDNEQEDNQGSHKRRKVLDEATIKRRQRRNEIAKYEDLVDTYYSRGTNIETSTTAIIYALLATIGETNVDNLWIAIIGTSSLDIQYPEIYEKMQPLFKNEVLRLKPSNHQNAEKTADTFTLDVEKDYHLFLLRHWTLYDSFYYSSFVNSKLNLWTEDGRKKLHKLFAKMGISLATAQQNWPYMDVSIKKQLPYIFKKYLPLYGLEGLMKDGFVKTFGYVGQLSAIECVEALTALLEMDHRLLSDTGVPIASVNQDLIDNDEDNDDEKTINSRIEKKERIWVNNFWSSWDALTVGSGATSKTSGKNGSGLKNKKGYDLLIEGLEHAKMIQKVIFRTGTSLLERKLVKNLRLYRLCVLNDGSIPDLVIFNNPLMLSKLGNWLLENISELDFINNQQSLKPLLVASLDTLSDTYLVVGLAPKYPRGMNQVAKDKRSMGASDKDSRKDMSEKSELFTRLNTFSIAFNQIANTSGAKVRIDSFDSSVIEIRKDDLSPFLEKLTLSGLI